MCAMRCDASLPPIGAQRASVRTREVTVASVACMVRALEDVRTTRPVPTPVVLIEDPFLLVGHSAHLLVKPSVWQCKQNGNETQLAEEVATQSNALNVHSQWLGLLLFVLLQQLSRFALFLLEAMLLRSGSICNPIVAVSVNRSGSHSN